MAHTATEIGWLRKTFHLTDLAIAVRRDIHHSMSSRAFGGQNSSSHPVGLSLVYW